MVQNVNLTADWNSRGLEIVARRGDAAISQVEGDILSHRVEGRTMRT
jgi:hypothetical protein